MFKAIRKVLSKVGRSRDHSADDLFKSAKSEINHFAFILDGSRRWAKLNGKTIQEGYDISLIEVVLPLIEYVLDKDVTVVSALGVSINNLRRPSEQVAAFLSSFCRMLENMLPVAKKKGWRIKIMGRPEMLPQAMQDLIVRIETETRANSAKYFNLALAYSGPDEICRAFKKFVQAGNNPENITPEGVMEYLDTAGLPYPHPDLIFRPSGDQRASGFLCFQSHYAELYVTKTSIADLTVKDIDQVFANYAGRRRRFGL